MMSASSSDWYKDAVLYELYVRAYRDSDGDGHGDLRGVVEKLDYVKSLGVDAIWLLPLMPSPLRDDGYDVSDFYSIHENYGNLDDFNVLVREAHTRSLKVIVELIMNHTSSEHPWFQESRSSKDNPKRNWYVWSDSDEKYAGTRVIFVDTEGSNWTKDELTGEYYWHRFFSHQPDLNYDNPEVQAEMKKVVKFWIDLGVDGFRMDAIPYLFEREGTNNENIAETHDFLKELRSYVDSLKPDCFLLGEVNQWPEDTLPYFGDGTDEMPMLFHFPVMPRLYKAVAEGKRDSVSWIMANTPDIPETCQWVVFLRNHDELTLEMVTEDERAFMYKTYAPDPEMKKNVGIRRRLAPLLDNDQRKLKLMNSMLMTLPGTPIVYYGDELGMGDNIALYDRNGVRTPMQWEDSHNAGFSEAGNLYAPVIADANFGYKWVNVAVQDQDPESLLNFMRELIKVRKQHPALGRGTFEILEPENNAILPFLNTSEGDVVIALHNLSADAQTVSLDLSRYDGQSLQDCFSGEDVGQASVDVEVTLEPYQFIWYSVQP
ncbi:MAG: maltose alpha-D-glucosyltransferase [Deinococcota bacterium]